MLDQGDIAVFGVEGPPVGQIWRNLPPDGPIECVVRVYVIRGIGLQPKDYNGRSDAYVQVTRCMSAPASLCVGGGAGRLLGAQAPSLP